MAAAAKASLVANRHVCGNRWINLEKARLILDDSFAASRGEGTLTLIYITVHLPLAFLCVYARINSSILANMASSLKFHH